MKKYFLQTQVFTFLSILIFGTSCYGQAKLRRNLGSLKDKAHNVHCSLQDKTGNLWFGTTGDGLYKYDGKSFTQFTTSNGLNHNAINHLLEDKDGKIWVATDDGVCFYDPSAVLRNGEKTFAKIQMPLLKDIPSNQYEVWCIIQDKSGKLWFATIHGVYIYDGKSFNFFKVTDDTKECYYKMEYILEDKAGNFWFGGRCNAGVFRYDGKTISHLKPKGEDWAWPVLQDKKGNIWFSNWKGAYLYDGKLFKKVEGLSDAPITRIIEDKKGNIWFGGGGRGICRYDWKTFTCFTAKDGLLNNDVWSILEDKTGILWVGTRETILHRFDGKTFTSYTE